MSKDYVPKHQYPIDLVMNVIEPSFAHGTPWRYVPLRFSRDCETKGYRNISLNSGIG